MPPEPGPEAAARLQQLLGGADLRALRQRLRRVFEQAAPGADPAVLRLSSLAPHEAEALQSLSGRAPRQSASVQIDLRVLAERLQAAGLAASLRGALELIDGPIAARATERAAKASAWAALAAAVPNPGLQPLLASAAGLGLLKRLAGGDAVRALGLCEQVARVLQALPATGQPRASLAALYLGDAHALDNGQPVATLVLAALRLGSRHRAAEKADAAELADKVDKAEGVEEVEGDEGRRALWAAQGVSVNELARPALGLNLPLPGLLPDGEPRYWSLRHLLRAPPAWQLCGLASGRAGGRDVFVCENPNLVAMAADALGPRCAPLVCTDGMPAAAQRALLTQLTAAGARLRYHGDFDGPGIAIANRVLQDFGAQPWRMGTADYRAAVDQTAPAARAPLRGSMVAASWDDALSATMQASSCAIAEEALAQSLLADLG